MNAVTKLRKKKGTKTSSFGAPGRINHDSSGFYATKLYEGLPTEKKVKYFENPIRADFIDTIFCKSSEHMSDLPDESVHLMVTSPPYNVGKEYDEDYTLKDYLDFLNRVWKEVHRVLVPGGRACINIANLGRKPYIPLHSYVIKQMLDIGFLMRGELIWNKASSASPSTAWGSWLSPANPTLRDIHEYILVFSKDTYSRPNEKQRRLSLTKDEFMECTRSVWTFKAESARKVGHPAPFPIELPLRLMKLYTYESEIILDPFMGSGQTAIAALSSNRHYIGYDLDKQYVKLATKRISDYLIQAFSPKLFDKVAIGAK
ncbi:MAG: DNA-methyltransferase [Candidatus Zixiibacteriota bacterium]